MKNSSDPIGNRTRYVPACSAVPQPTAPPRAPNFKLRTVKLVLTPLFILHYVAEEQLVTQFLKYQNFRNLVKGKNVVWTHKQRLETKPHPTEPDQGTLQD
jgi:hypothetical protein